MKAHYSAEEWTAYVLGKDIDRVSMETHLERCEACRMLYLGAVEEQSGALPELGDVAKFVDEVERRLAAQKTAKSGRQPAPGRPRPIAQYLVAASLTMLLAGSGAFQMLFNTFGNLVDHVEDVSSPAISQRLADSALSWLDGIPAMNQRNGEGK